MIFPLSVCYSSQFWLLLLSTHLCCPCFCTCLAWWLNFCFQFYPVLRTLWLILTLAPLNPTSLLSPVPELPVYLSIFFMLLQLTSLKSSNSCWWFDCSKATWMCSSIVWQIIFRKGFLFLKYCNSIVSAVVKIYQCFCGLPWMHVMYQKSKVFSFQVDWACTTDWGRIREGSIHCTYLYFLD